MAPNKPRTRPELEMIDLTDPAGSRAARKRARPTMTATLGLVLEDRGSGIVGALMEFNPPRIVLRDRHGKDHSFRYDEGSVRAGIDGKGVPVDLVAPAPVEVALTVTASGSIDLGAVPARVARASRIWVEGIHDAELIEKVWGDDLRVEGIVVEQLEGADDLLDRVRGFRPTETRRLGVLLDHLVDGSKESRIAAEIHEPGVLIAGHPYVDVWQAVKPSVLGISEWPVIPKGQPWKEGIIDAVGFSGPSGAFWKQLLGKVESWTDLEAPMLSAVEQLIDFVAPPDS